jgi:hypothetical protein
MEWNVIDAQGTTGKKGKGDNFIDAQDIRGKTVDG